MFNIALSREEHLVVVCTGAPVVNDYLAAVGLIAEWSGARAPAVS